MAKNSWDKYRITTGTLVVLSGPSGVGKDSILDRLEEIYPAARRCVTATTRRRRSGEAEGIDYFFLDKREFEEGIAKGGFLEYANVHGNLYGTPKEYVLEQLREGIDVILKIDVQGAENICRQLPDTVTVFVVPPSEEELLRRLTMRKTETEDEIRVRFENAKKEFAKMHLYDYIIENDTVEDAAERLKAVLVSLRCKNGKKSK